MTPGLYVWTTRGWHLVTSVKTDSWLTTIETTLSVIVTRPHERMDILEYYEGS